MNKYIPLHVHSHYSLLDGLSQPKQIAKRINEIEATACALTDHGNIAGHIQFHQVMKKNGIKPILGCELYICEESPKLKNKDNSKLSHMLVLAKNYQGWLDLIRIVSESNKPEHYYHKPRLDLETLSTFTQNNLICITGHLGSTLSNLICREDKIISDYSNVGVAYVDRLKEAFGKENVFLESQLMDMENISVQKDLSEATIDIAKKTGVKIICTPDAHYARKEDAVDQRILLCNNLKTTFPEINRRKLWLA